MPTNQKRKKVIITKTNRTQVEKQDNLIITFSENLRAQGLNPNLIILIIILPIAIILSICALIFGFSREEVWNTVNFWENNGNNMNSEIRDSTSNASDMSVISAQVQKKTTYNSQNAEDNDIHVNLEVSRTRTELETGLMNRATLGENNGMLFVFEKPQILSFWMKDTYIGLDIAFLDQNGHIINIAQNAKPLDTTQIYKSNDLALYAVEMNANWFDNNDIKAGDMFKFSLD